MSRFFLLLSAVALLAVADIPSATRGTLVCTNPATITDLQCGNTVANILTATGLSLMDFILLQDQNMGYIYPSTVLQPNDKFCIAGYFL